MKGRGVPHLPPARDMPLLRQRSSRSSGPKASSSACRAAFSGTAWSAGFRKVACTPAQAQLLRAVGGCVVAPSGVFWVVFPPRFPYYIRPRHVLILLLCTSAAFSGTAWSAGFRAVACTALSCSASCVQWSLLQCTLAAGLISPGLPGQPASERWPANKPKLSCSACCSGGLCVENCGILWVSCFWGSHFQVMPFPKLSSACCVLHDCLVSRLQAEGLHTSSAAQHATCRALFKFCLQPRCQPWCVLWAVPHKGSGSSVSGLGCGPNPKPLVSLELSPLLWALASWFRVWGGGACWVALQAGAAAECRASTTDDLGCAVRSPLRYHRERRQRCRPSVHRLHVAVCWGNHSGMSAQLRKVGSPEPARCCQLE